jgi:hypothetical protein
MLTIRNSIQTSLKTDLPPDVLAGVIAPLVTTVNQWSTQIPVLLEGTGSTASVNIVFAIRSDLFHAPRFTQNVFGLPLNELPAPYQEFVSFIHKLIDAQKTSVKVCLVFIYYRLVRLRTVFVAVKTFRSHNQV